MQYKMNKEKQRNGNRNYGDKKDSDVDVWPDSTMVFGGKQNRWKNVIRKNVKTLWNRCQSRFVLRIGTDAHLQASLKFLLVHFMCIITTQMTDGRLYTPLGTPMCIFATFQSLTTDRCYEYYSEISKVISERMWNQ